MTKTTKTNAQRQKQLEQIHSDKNNNKMQSDYNKGLQPRHMQNNSKNYDILWLMKIAHKTNALFG